MLSPQQHYDWGLRALKTVLRGSGSLLETEKKTRGQKKGEATCLVSSLSQPSHVGAHYLALLFLSPPVSGVVEVHLVVQALRLNTLSKLTFSDGQRFNALVRDVFPGVEFSDVEYERLDAALREASRESNLVIIDRQVGWTSCLRLHIT